MPFTYADLFAGIGGFHAVMSALGGTCVLVSEIDPGARAVYERNWGADVVPAAGRPLLEDDIVGLTEPEVAPHVPEIDVLCAGFPCQPFSKSGRQRGINETRGTLFFNIAKLLEARRPSVILLENVRNLAGPRHAETWATIVHTLRGLGYRVSGTPTVFSPHLLPPEQGGTPQVRERVFIVGTYVGRTRAMAATDVPPPVPRRPVPGWDPRSWDVGQHLPLETESAATQRYRLSAAEQRWIDVWADFVARLLEVREGVPLPGFPLWADAFRVNPAVPAGAPGWKVDFLTKNSGFYREHREVIDAWRSDHPELKAFPPSRRKLEWQAQDLPSLWDAVLHLRPSGIRAKQPTYLPALVAITQTSVVGPRRRRITPREAARLQGLPDWFDFGTQADKATYKQLGNGVAVGAAYHVLREHVLADPDVPGHIADAVRDAGPTPRVERPASRLRTA
ncbi:MAG TPA: DNA (cytosine-5-)-methyltransferase [Mycobacteriales bacterium]|jgi:DNA (cytosine-5)-methyltransferase 1|nr:DNA (cytosine-5-)-methyltransferase [Mycobacteriales bacterium]